MDRNVYGPYGKEEDMGNKYNKPLSIYEEASSSSLFLDIGEGKRQREKSSGWASCGPKKGNITF